MITVKAAHQEILNKTTDDGREFLAIYYVGAIGEMVAKSKDGNEIPVLGFDIVGPNVDQLDLANLLDKYGSPAYTIKVISGTPDSKELKINSGLEDLEIDLKSRMAHR